MLSADPGAAGTVAIGETLRRGPLADCKVDGSQCMSPVSALESHLMEGDFFVFLIKNNIEDT